jgi:hypothetical protein
MNISGYQICVVLEKRKILCEKYISYIFHVFSEARDHILILNILFFNKLRQIIPEVRSPIPNVIRVVYFDHLLEPLKCVLHLLF